MNQTAAQTEAQRTALAGARIKGSHMRPFLAWYTSQGGQERTGRLVDGVPEQYRSLFDPLRPDLGILDSSWYPAEPIHALLDGILEGVSAGDRTSFAREGARVAMEATLRGVYRFLFEMMMTPDRYLKKAQVLFSRYNEPGTVTKTEIAPRTHLSVIRDWTGHHPYICELMFYASIAIYENMGCRNVVGRRIACVSEGAAECRYTIEWDA
jgi:hypothetical protein